MENKNIEQYTKKIVQNAGLNQPNRAFLDNILSAISHQVDTKIVYTPLISKKVWLLILLISSAFLIGYFIAPQSISISYLNSVEYKIPTLNLPHLSISAISLYSIVFLSLFLFQIPILKYYLERRIT